MDRDTFQIILTAPPSMTPRSKLVLDVQPEIQNADQLDVAVRSFTWTCMFYNLDAGWNTLRFSADSGTSWVSLTIPPGAYDLETINDTIQNLIVAAGGQAVVDMYMKINITADPTTNKIVTSIAQSYRLDLTNAGTSRLYEVLGYTTVEAAAMASAITHGDYIASNVARINSNQLNLVSQVVLRTNITDGAVYSNPKISNSILAFTPTWRESESVEPGLGGGGLNFIPVTVRTLSRIEVTICNDEGIELPVSGDAMVLTLQFRRRNNDLTAVLNRLADKLR